MVTDEAIGALLVGIECITSRTIAEDTSWRVLSVESRHQLVAVDLWEDRLLLGGGHIRACGGGPPGGGLEAACPRQRASDNHRQETEATHVSSST